MPGSPPANGTNSVVELLQDLWIEGARIDAKDRDSRGDNEVPVAEVLTK
jgi:hypothetical protein